MRSTLVKLLWPINKISNVLARRRLQRQDRDAFMQLVWQEDRTLIDAGLSREDVNWAVQLPLHKNAALELRNRLQASANDAPNQTNHTMRRIYEPVVPTISGKVNFEPLLCRC